MLIMQYGDGTVAVGMQKANHAVADNCFTACCNIKQSGVERAKLALSPSYHKQSNYRNIKE